MATFLSFGIIKSITFLLMKIKQELSWYKKEYLNKNWLAKKSGCYVFNYFKNSLAEKDIDKIIALKKDHYNKILLFLGLSNKQVIHYYFYPSLKDKIALMGDDSPGNAIWEEFELVNDEPKTKKFEIHVVYNKKCKFIGEHEDTHLLSLPLGLSIYLFCEGLAQFMEENLFGKDIDFLSKKLLRRNKLYYIKNLVDNKNWDDVKPKIVYPQAGSFTRFLINTYGWNKYRKVYKKLSRLNTFSKNLKIIKSSFEKSVEGLEKEWRNYLKSV